MKVPSPTEDEQRRLLELKYNVTAWFYDLLDYPWERQCRHWRSQLVGELRGEVLEAGVGNRCLYPEVGTPSNLGLI